MRRPLTVLCVNDLAYILESLKAQLSQLGVDVRVIGSHPGDPARAEAPFVVKVMGIYRDLCRDRDFDVLHINYALFGFVALGQRAPRVLHIHGSDIRPDRALRARIANLLSRASFGLSDRIWYSTSDLAPLLRGLTNPTPRFMPSPVDPRFFSVLRGTSLKARVLFAVPLSFVKGADVAVNAMQRLAKTHPEIEISAFGFGPDQKIAAGIRKFIPPSVRLVPWIPHSEMPRVLSSADVIVGGLRLGGLGVTELEALATGAPVIAAVRDGLSRVEPYYRSDPPVLSGDAPDSVVDQVASLLANRDSLMGLGTKGKEWVREYHSVERVASLYESEYRSLLE